MLFTLALRNVLRNKGRFFLSAFVVTFASMMLVFSTSQIAGVKKSLERGMIDTLTGHVMLKHKDTPQDFFDLSTGLRLNLIEPAALADIMAKIEALEEIEAVAPRISLAALVGDGENSTPAYVIAVDPEREAKVTKDMAELLPKLGSNLQAALISPNLIKKTGLPVGEEILVTTPTPLEVLNGRPYDIVDELISPHLIDEYTNMIMFITIERARQMIYVEDVASEIVVRVKPEYLEELPKVVEKIQAQLSPEELAYIRVYSYSDVAKSIKNIGNIATGMASIQLGAILFVMLIIVAIITKMSIVERYSEIGTLMAIGMTQLKITGLLISEVILKIIFGYTLGLLIALFMLQGIKRSGGIRATNLVEQYMNGGKILLPVIDPLNIAFGLVIVLTSGLAVTFYGCWRAGDQSAIQLINSKM